MTTPRRPGRKRTFHVKGWGPIPNGYPLELVEAFREYCHEKRLQQTNVIREFLEQLLERQGFLRVVTKTDPDTGHEVVAYEVPQRKRS